MDLNFFIFLTIFMLFHNADCCLQWTQHINVLYLFDPECDKNRYLPLSVTSQFNLRKEVNLEVTFKDWF